MIVLDTHTWIWWVSAPDQLSAAAASAIASAKRIGIAAISCWEFVMLCHKGRIAVAIPPLDWMEQSLAANNIDRLDLTPQIAAGAYDLGRSFQGDPADRLIVATAVVHAATLVTKDDHIRNSGAVACVW
jgi:PIN domain nuclease of toxin-antitoxin system